MTKTKEENVEKEGLTIKKTVAKEAISVLKKLNENFADGQSKKPLFDDSAENLIYLQVTLKKIPPKKLKRMIKVKLPHSLLTNTTEVCLITGDLDKRDKKAEIEPTVQHYKDLLNKHGVKGISEVVPLRQLRTEYKTFESKRQLSAAYDVFLSDKKINGVLPSILGKAFYDKRKFPIQINLDTANLKEQVERALSEVVFPISCRGNSCTSEVARISMEDKDILENILTCVKSLEDNVPGKWINILGLYIKTAKSDAIPIYMTFGDTNDVKIKVPRHQEKVKAEELSTLNNAEVKVYRDGRVVVKNLPPEDEDMPAIQNMKSTEEEEGENIGEESLNNEQEAVSKSNKSKKNKSAENKDDSVCETNDLEESKLDVEKSVKKKNKKRKSISQNEDSPVCETNDKDFEEESKIDTENSVQKKSKKRKSAIQNDNSVCEINNDFEEESKIDMGNSVQKKSKKRKSTIQNEDNSVCEVNNEVTNDVEEESEVVIESSAQKKSKKRKSTGQSNKSEPIHDLNAIKKRLRSQIIKEIKIEASALTDDQEEETKIKSSLKKTPKRKSKKFE